MKRIIALLLTFVCVVSFVGCGGNNNEEVLATEVATAFLDAMCAWDADAMGSYLDNPDAVPERIKNLKIENILAKLPEELAVYKDNFIKTIITLLVMIIISSVQSLALRIIMLLAT